MTERIRTDRSYSVKRNDRKIAWPARTLSWVIGRLASPVAPASGRLRYSACTDCANSVGLVGLVTSAFLMCIKGYLGIVGHSTALLADAIHSSADLISALMLVIGLRVARRPANKQYPYGYGKIEFIVSLVIYTALIGAGIVIVITGVKCIASCLANVASVEPSVVTLFGAFIGIVVNEMMYRQSFCAGKQIASPSLVANAHEKRSDALTSIAVFAGIAGAKLGFPILDPIAALLVGFYIMRLSVKMLIGAFKGLLDRALDPQTLAGIYKATKGVENVRGIETVSTREIGQQVWIDLGLFVDGDSSVGDAERTKDEVRRAVSEEIGRSARIEVYLKPVQG